MMLVLKLESEIIPEVLFGKKEELWISGSCFCEYLFVLIILTSFYEDSFKKQEIVLSLSVCIFFFGCLENFIAFYSLYLF